MKSMENGSNSIGDNDYDFMVTVRPTGKGVLLSLQYMWARWEQYGTDLTQL